MVAVVSSVAYERLVDAHVVPAVEHGALARPCNTFIGVAIYAFMYKHTRKQYVDTHARTRAHTHARTHAHTQIVHATFGEDGDENAEARHESRRAGDETYVDVVAA